MAYRDPLLVDFALQGGGSHGAFTWGALDRLLEEKWLKIDGISGTSAGAMNAAVLADGLPKAVRTARARRSRLSGERSRAPA
jgi:NTE family protein